MAPTTLAKQVTTTSPLGRDVKTSGYPIRMSELLLPLQGVKYIERVKATDAISIIRTKKAIKKAFMNQITHVGFSFIEVLSNCPTNWKKDPVESNKWVDETMAEFFQIGKIKDIQ